MRNIEDAVLTTDLSDITVERLVDGQLGDEGLLPLTCHHHAVPGEGHVPMEGWVVAGEGHIVPVLTKEGLGRVDGGGSHTLGGGTGRSEGQGCGVQGKVRQ